MSARLYASPITNFELLPSLEDLLLTLVAMRQSRPSSTDHAFTITRYHGDSVSLWCGLGGLPIEATRDHIEALIDHGYLEWVVPPLMVHRLDVTHAGLRYADAILGRSPLHVGAGERAAA